MKIEIPYNNDLIDVDFPAGTTVLQGKKTLSIDSEIVRRKISDSLAKYQKVFDRNKISVIINDATRRVPNDKILKIILEFIPIERLEILIATGSHRPPTENDLKFILGDLRSEFDGRIFIHDCHDNQSLIHLGITSRGTPIAINKKLAESEAIICINSVEPHFFAGFTGGRKSFIPGLAGFETIVQNHSLAKYEDAKSLNLETNPVHLDLEEAINPIRNKAILSIQLNVNRQGDIADIYCGDLNDSFKSACKSASQMYSVKILNKYDIVFAIGEPPLDINLYQLQKGQEHGAEAVADDGILIVVGACNEGTGSPYFFESAETYPTPESALTSKALNDSGFGMHKLVKTARRLRKMKIWYVTNLDDNLIRKVYYESKNSLEKALSDALKLKGDSSRIAVLMDACYSVPII